MPPSRRFLPGARDHRVAEAVEEEYDVFIALDCSVPQRLGEGFRKLIHKSAVVVNIDHHKTSEFYGDINIVEPHSSSTAEIVYRLFHNMTVNVTRREAACLYTGMVTDTGRFHFPATSPRTLEIASRLLETGFKFSRINDLLYATKAPEALKILGRALESMESKAGGKLSVLTLTLADFKEFDARSEHAENVINYGMMPPSAKAAVMFREENERISVTFRSRGHIDVSLVAKGRFDKGSLRARRLDVLATLNLDPMSLQLQYANYASQPAIGFDVRRQGLSATGRYDITKNYFLTGTVTFDMSRYLYNALTTIPATTVPITGINLTGTAPLFSVATLGGGIGYQDECTTLSINYSQIYQPQSYTGLPARNQTVMVTLQFRTLGEAKFNYGVGSVLVNDGVRNNLPR